MTNTLKFIYMYMSSTWNVMLSRRMVCNVLTCMQTKLLAFVKRFHAALWGESTAGSHEHHDVSCNRQLKFHQQFILTKKRKHQHYTLLAFREWNPLMKRSFLLIKYKAQSVLMSWYRHECGKIVIVSLFYDLSYGNGNVIWKKVS